MTKKATARSQRTKTAKTASLQPTELEIAKGAYYRYLERDGNPGDELSDWLQAECELQAARSIA